MLSEKKKDYLTIGLVCFVYTLGVSLIVDYVLLPHFKPGLYAGDGLYKGFDSVFFHETALKILSQGSALDWLVKHFRFGDYSSAVGFQALVYEMTIQKPVVMLPISSLGVSLSSVLVFKIVQSLTSCRLSSYIGAVLFFIFPSSLQWVAQWSKEPFFILGILVFYTSVIGIMGSHKTYNAQILSFVLILMLGMAWCFFLRPYSVYFLSTSVAVSSLLLLLLYYSGGRSFPMNPSSLVLILSVVILFSMLLLNWPLYRNRSGYSGTLREMQLALNQNISENTLEKEQWTPVFPGMPYERGRIAILPDVVDRNIYKIAYIRARFLWIHKQANMNIDPEYKIQNALDFLKYLPKAVITGLVYPTPYTLTKPGRNFMHKIVQAEMIVLYLGLFGFFLALFRRGRAFCHQYIFILISSATYIGLCLITAPNMGTMYRHRYGMIMMITALGVSGIVKTLKGKW